MTKRDKVQFAESILFEEDAKMAFTLFTRIEWVFIAPAFQILILTCICWGNFEILKLFLKRISAEENISNSFF